MDAIFNESFGFNIIVTENELKTMKILMTVMHNTKWYRRDEEIGSVSIDAWTVFSKQTHMLNKVWAVIEKEGMSEAGHINYSILVIGESHKLLALRGDMDDDEEEKDGGEENNKKRTYLKELVQGAPPIEKKSYLLSLSIYQGEFVELPWIKEMNSKIKVILSEGDITESLIISNSRTPGWKEQYNLPMKSPFYITYIIVEVWYEQSGEKLLGRFCLDFNQLIKDGQLEVKWNLIYGPERENSLMRKLKYQYKFGTEVEQHFYFGRVLCSAKWVQDDNPARMKYPSPDVQYPEERMYVFWFDCYELTSKFLSSNDEIFIECQVGDKVVNKKTPAAYNTSLKKFYWKNEKEIRFKEFTIMMPSDVTQIPDIFIRIKKKGGLFSDDEYIAYCRFKPQELLTNRTFVKAKWQKLRMCKTQVKGDSDENYLGLLLCSVNFFTKTDTLQERPIVIETRNFKKYKLISIIYMANDLPVLNKGSLPSPMIEITFNGKTRKTKIANENINPVYGEIMFISTYLNDVLDLSENIRMSVIDKGGLTSPLLGYTEIEVGKIQKYNSQAYLESDLYKHAQWYHLYEGAKKLKAKVLASFLIVKLTKQGKEIISLDNNKFNIWPEEEMYRIYLFIIGVRKVPNSVNVVGACVMPCINTIMLEKIEDKEEFFQKKSGSTFDNNLNVLDEISDDGVAFIRYSISKQKIFVNPMSLLVKRGNNTILTANVDLTNFIQDQDEKKDILGNINKEKLEKKQKKKKMNFNPMPEDFFPIYLDEKKTEIERTKDNTNSFIKNVCSFPFEQEETNALVGEEITIHIYKQEVDKKGNIKNEDDMVSSYNRPDIDNEYEDELIKNELPFCTSNLQMSGENDGDANYGLIRYVLKLMREDDTDENKRKLEEEFETFKEELFSLREVKNKNLFVCRIYLLNTSNLHVDDNTVEQAYVWIRRWEGDREWKDEKKAFQVSTGEINQCYSMMVQYPETFFITIQFLAIKKIAGLIEQHDIIGETEIDLEHRYFHHIYKSKIDNHKTFKQIPVESRTLYHEKQVRGAVRMWLELVPKSREQELLPERLVAQAMDRYEIRLIIWNTRDIPTVDGGKIDIMVKVMFNDGDKDIEQETDVHSDSKDGNGKFNWRIVMPFKYPNNKSSITVSIYDWNGLTSNNLISSNVINIKKYLNRVHRTKTAVDFPRDWLPMSNIIN